MRLHRQFLNQRGPIVHHFPFEVLPIIKSSPPKRGIVGTKTERPHKPQFRPDGHTGPADIAGIVMNLRLMQDDVELGLVGHSFNRIKSNIKHKGTKDTKTII
jgi:hypothetical protein